MAFTPLTSTEVSSGKPVTTTVMGKIKDNFDDHENRLQIIESGTAVTYPPIVLRLNGTYSHRGTFDGIVITTTNFPIQITGVRLNVDTAGSSGTTEIDIKYKRGGGSWTSILTTKPSLAHSAGNNAISSNAVLNPSEVTLQAGDLIRMDLTSSQTDGVGFFARIDYSGA